VTTGAARDVDQGAVISGEEAETFTYSTAEERRAASEPKGGQCVRFFALLCAGRHL
jgi:hypothetical protein